MIVVFGRSRADSPGAARLILSARRSAMARGSVCRPLRKLPTVWPLGLGGRAGSRGGGGLRLRSCISLSTPPMMLPPFFSRSYTCTDSQVNYCRSSSTLIYILEGKAEIEAMSQRHVPCQRRPSSRAWWGRPHTRRSRRAQSGAQKPPCPGFCGRTAPRSPLRLFQDKASCQAQEGRPRKGGECQARR